ncbi:hypothetical protein SERLA73DRAFT_117361 [Serpula lacrymans var. lacrymans S7.3]|uniref:Uncharacterized protein n=2 Tax=Serpula lacrymans var. lacrymans TaxID=341189 RepID=F8QGY1_SERL3|nr:uncharacterized protein SERLADRAFT_443927 [Serpula lacrymans var. lacrymans S7.9]EGN92463.1 hypothetical protein SERLA73DRAFT_117361 [Serpula lacrymans var. lacrymans S7.3]EGO18590.1 hypothetical protein SERLADRAFT_443927 [Serpula lacrymans var. lacrymans S7.9]
MAWRATDNLRCYLQEARLPQMKPGPTVQRQLSENSHAFDNTLSVRSERYRKLQRVLPLNREELDDYICAWTEEFVPCLSLGVEDEDEKTGERFSVPCQPFYNVPPLPLGRPADIERLFMWMDHLPLETVQRTVHLLYPQTRKWTFISGEDSTDYRLFRSLMWSLPIEEPSTHPEVTHHSLCIFLQPPWILSVEDMEYFAAYQSFHLFNSNGSSPPLSLRNNDKIWSKVWDTCVRKDCPWFVVSTYAHWVFGVFSTGWTAAFVSPVYSYDSHDPTILQTLLFWAVSAMGLPGGWKIPVDRTEPAVPRQEVPCTVYDIIDLRTAEKEALAHFSPYASMSG